MKVVLDTSSLYEDLPLTGAKIRTLCEKAKITGDTIYIPQVVIDEAKNKFKERLLEIKIKIDKGYSDLSRLTKQTHQSAFTNKSIDAEILSFSKTFDDQIKKLDIKIIPYPKTSHKIIAEKAIKKRKPFSQNGKGYRDALIWENIKGLITPAKKLMEDPQVVFITGNHHDFCENGYNLHSELKDEVEEIGSHNNAVEIIEDFDKFISKYYFQKLKRLDEFKNEFIKGKHQKLKLREKVEKLVYGFLDNKEFDAIEVGFPQEYENPTVSGIYEDYKFNIEQIRQLSEEEIIIDCSVDVTCNFDFFMAKFDYYALDDDEGPDVYNHDWNDYYVAATQTKVITLKVLVTVDSAFRTIISNEIDVVTKKTLRYNSEL